MTLVSVRVELPGSVYTVRRFFCKLEEFNRALDQADIAVASGYLRMPVMVKGWMEEGDEPLHRHRAEIFPWSADLITCARGPWFDPVLWAAGNIPCDEDWP